MFRNIISSVLLLLQLCHADFLGMTAMEKKMVKKTWATFNKDSTIGEDILLEALKMYPEARQQFNTFANIPLEKLKEEPTFRAQGSKTLEAVSRVVADLYNEERLALFLKEIGQMHRRRKVPTEDFKTFHLAVVSVMKSRMGPSLSPSAEAALSKLMKKMIDRIIQEYHGNKEDAYSHYLKG